MKFSTGGAFSCRPRPARQTAGRFGARPRGLAHARNPWPPRRAVKSKKSSQFRGAPRPAPPRRAGAGNVKNASRKRHPRKQKFSPPHTLVPMKRDLLHEIRNYMSGPANSALPYTHVGREAWRVFSLAPPRRSRRLWARPTGGRPGGAPPKPRARVVSVAAVASLLSQTNLASVAWVPRGPTPLGVVSRGPWETRSAHCVPNSSIAMFSAPAKNAPQLAHICPMSTKADLPRTPNIRPTRSSAASTPCGVRASTRDARPKSPPFSL